MSKVVTVYHNKSGVMPAEGTRVEAMMWDYEPVAVFRFTDRTETPLDAAWLWTQNWSTAWRNVHRPEMTVLVDGYCRETTNGDLLEMDGKYYVVGKDFREVQPITVAARLRTRS